MSDVPGFLQQMEQKAETFFHNMEAEVNAVVHPEAAAEAGNAPAVAAESATAPAIADMEQGNINNGQAMDAPNQVADLPNVASVADAHIAEAASAPSAAGESITSPIDESSAEPKAFEQLVEERFQMLEAAFLKLPESIATVMHRGSLAPEEFAAAVHAHLFGKQ